MIVRMPARAASVLLLLAFAAGTSGSILNEEIHSEAHGPLHPSDRSTTSTDHAARRSLDDAQALGTNSSRYSTFITISSESRILNERTNYALPVAIEHFTERANKACAPGTHACVKFENGLQFDANTWAWGQTPGSTFNGNCRWPDSCGTYYGSTCSLEFEGEYEGEEERQAFLNLLQSTIRNQYRLSCETELRSCWWELFGGCKSTNDVDVPFLMPNYIRIDRWKNTTEVGLVEAGSLAMFLSCEVSHKASTKLCGGDASTFIRAAASIVGMLPYAGPILSAIFGEVAIICDTMTASKAERPDFAALVEASEQALAPAPGAPRDEPLPSATGAPTQIVQTNDGPGDPGSTFNPKCYSISPPPPSPPPPPPPPSPPSPPPPPPPLFLNDSSSLEGGATDSEAAKAAQSARTPWWPAWAVGIMAVARALN